MTEGGDKTFQGLIYAAAAFVHYPRRECAGAKELLSRSQCKIQPVFFTFVTILVLQTCRRRSDDQKF